MKYLVIEGRAPQDGSAAKRALILCPKWMSSTLVCAGIVGRVVELTDGNIIEEGNVPMSEQECLEGLRLDAAADLESQQEDVSDFAEPTHQGPRPELPNTDPHAADDAYRQGMQATREVLRKELQEFIPEGTAFTPAWLHGQLAELGRLRASETSLIEQWENMAAVLEKHGITDQDNRVDWLDSRLARSTEDGFNSDKNVRELRHLCVVNGYSPAEMGALLPWLEAQLGQLKTANANLDAWRDAAGSAGLVQECNAMTGQIMRLYLPIDATESDAEDRMQNALDQRDDEIERLRTLLKGIRRMTKKASR